MRYQNVSPDCLPLNNGKKGSMKACKEDGEAIENGRIVPPNVYGNNGSSSSSSFETKSFRFRSPSRTQDNNNTNLSQFGSVLFSHQSDTNLHNHEPNNKHHQTQTQTQAQTQTQRPETSPSASSSPNRGGDMLLQWGHKKRSRVSRTEIRALTDEPLSSSSSAQVRQALKLKRRAVTCATPDKLPTTSMPPPPPPLLALPSTAASSSSSSGRSRKVESSGFLPSRSLDGRCGGGAGNGSPSRNSGGNNRVVCRSTAGKRSAHQEKSERKVLSSSGRSIKEEKPNGSSGQLGDHANHVNHVDSGTNKTVATSEKVTDNNNNTEVNEWPRIYIALSRKEKEDDFLAMKGTKLPQRPKKRAKNIDRTLQYCFPGMWLSDLTRNRYEVREKKCVKKQKWRGLKGMESLDSESE